MKTKLIGLKSRSRSEDTGPKVIDRKPPFNRQIVPQCRVIMALSFFQMLFGEMLRALEETQTNRVERFIADVT